MKKFYLLLLMVLFVSVGFSQAPGGVATNLTLWLKADAASTLSSTDSLNSWTYANDGTKSFVSVPTNRPIVKAASLNFLPSVLFTGSQEMDGPNLALAPLPLGAQAYSIFAVWQSNVAANTNPQRVWSQRTSTSNGDGAALWIYNGQYGDQPEIGPAFTYGLGLPYTQSVPYISEVNLHAVNTNDLELVDQTSLSSPVILSTDPANNATANRKVSTDINRLGSRNIPTEEPFIGNLAELIVYSTPVDAGAARNRIFSYLSLKYGIPIQTNVVSSAGTTLWDATANSTYTHSLFGIGLDNGSGLANNQSNSSATAGVSAAGNIVLTAPTPLSTDQSFLLIGNDNGSLTETTSNLPPAASGSSRLGRNWKVQNINNVGPVNLDVDLTGLIVSGSIGTPSDFRLMVSNAGDPTYATASNFYYSPAGFTGNVANFTGVTLADGSLFTVITNASAGTPLPVIWQSVNARADGNNVDLSWVVGVNAQARVYEVEHSIDGVTFTPIGNVSNDPNVKSYQFEHVNAGPGKHFYRIHEVDLDGEAIYSQIVSVNIGTGDFSVAVLNNPASANTDAQLRINAVSGGKAVIELWTSGGSRISVTEQAVGAGVNTLPIPLSRLASDTYVMKVTVNGTTHTTQVVKL
ncbi:MAG TPA: hypothetical protein VGM30_06890 [Puia sp.]|jgi:hypothetical protein